MAVEAVVFDVSDTLVDAKYRLSPRLAAAIERLRRLGVGIVAACNQDARQTAAMLGPSGVRDLVDHVICRDDIPGRKAKGSPLWVDAIKQRTGLGAHQLFYVGDSERDMITATRGPMVYAHAGWGKPRDHAYGFDAPDPMWVPAVIEHCFRKKHPWRWAVDTTDARGRTVTARAIIDGNGAGYGPIKPALLDLVKNDKDGQVGPLTLSEFVVLHLLGSLGEANVLDGVDLWTRCPSSSGQQRPTVLNTALDTAARMYRDGYLPKLLVRHTPTQHSRAARRGGGGQAAIANQIRTVHVNPLHRERLRDKRVLVLDDFITAGYTVECARNMLLQAGAAEVVVAAIGKYDLPMQIVTAPAIAWDPFSKQVPSGTFHERREDGRWDSEALKEFVASFKGMAQESW